MELDWSKYPNFSKKEFDCKFTGKNRMRPEFLEVLQRIRFEYGKPMLITSGYRDKKHPIEARKAAPGEHSFGLACDVGVSGVDWGELFVIAWKHGIRRIGVKQHGDARFIHLGMGDIYLNFPKKPYSYGGK